MIGRDEEQREEETRMVKKVLGGRLACQVNCCHAISELSMWNYTGKRFPGVGVGLTNAWNSSYVNVILQCLTHTHSLIERLDSHPDPCNCGNKKFCVIRALKNHIKAALTTERDALSPENFIDILNYISNGFLPYQQEDAHDFLLAFLQKLESCCLDQKRYTSSQDINIVELVFGGRLKSALRCCNCSSVSETYERFLSLSIEIEDVDSLSSALECFTRVEKLEEQLNEKQLLLDKLPLVAIFHLKRFDKNKDKMQKICKAISIPFELDLTPYMRDGQHNEFTTNYYLYAFVEHVGTSLHFGHYISYVRSAPKIWHKFDDAKVTKINEDSVQTENSYIVFYAREDTPWVSGEINNALWKERDDSREDSPWVSEVINNALWKEFDDSMANALLKEIDELKSQQEPLKIIEPTGAREGTPSMVEPRLDIARVTNGDEPDDLFNVHSPKMQEDKPDHVLKVQNQDSSPKLQEDKPDHVLKVQNQDSSPKLQEDKPDHVLKVQNQDSSPKLQEDKPDHVLKVQNQDSSPKLQEDKPDHVLKVQNQDSSPKLQECSLEDSSTAELRLDIEPTGVGVGLTNAGNTCYLNAILQCLTHTRALIERLDSQDPCHCGNKKFCVIRALKNHIKAALTTERDALSPENFIDNLNYFSRHFKRNQQEDAHEFLEEFLNKLGRCCFDETKDMSSQAFNIVEHVFGGRLISELRCCYCSFVSETFEYSLVLSLEIEDVHNISSALELFTRVEKLEEQLTCDNCKETVSKKKQFLLDKLPLVATFHLKRFRKNRDVIEKICKAVDIPFKLDLKPYMRNGQHNEFTTNYYLYAFVEHVGTSLHFGHYISYVRSAPKIWHKFDDAKVTKINEDSVQTENSYIVFYAREDTPWVSGEIKNALWKESDDSREDSPWVSEEINNALWKESDDSREDSPWVSEEINNALWKDRECVSEISYGNKLCDSAGVTKPHVKTDEHCVSLSNETDEDVLLSPKCSGEDSSMVEPRLEIDRVTNGDEPDDLFNVHSPKLQDDSTGVSNPHVKTDEHCVSLPNETNEDVLLSPKCSGEDSSMVEHRLDITNGDEPDDLFNVHSPKMQDDSTGVSNPHVKTDEHCVSLPNETKEDVLLSTECSLEARAYASSMAKFRLDIDRKPNDDERYELFTLPPNMQGRIKNVFEKLRKCKLEDDKDKWDAKRELQKEEKRKKREAEEKRREELRKKKDKGRKK